MKDRKEAKRGKMKIGVGYFVIEKVGDVEKTREGETRRMRKDLVECV